MSISNKFLNKIFPELNLNLHKVYNICMSGFYNFSQKLTILTRYNFRYTMETFTANMAANDFSLHSFIITLLGNYTPIQGKMRC